MITCVVMLGPKLVGEQGEDGGRQWGYRVIVKQAGPGFKG